ncbi:restriction endonuclease subunit S [Helicobacter valdiviensis]|nr:restriction endonuclease subunit S [Helicobacter valdiviensis]
MTNLPQGWEVKKLGDIVQLRNGFAFKSNLFCDMGIPIIRIKNIQNESIVLNDLVFCNPSNYKNNLDDYLIQKNDILIAMSGATTGKIGLYSLNEKAYLNQRVGLLRINNDILRKYIFWFLYCNSEQNLARAFGAAQPNLSTEQIHNMQIPLPPLKEQRRIVKILDSAFASIDKSIELVKANLLYLEELSQSVLDKAFNPLKYTAPYSKDSISHCHSEAIAKVSKINQSHDAQPLKSRPLRGAKKEKKGGSSATALLKLEADTARLSPQNAKKQSAFLQSGVLRGSIPLTLERGEEKIFCDKKDNNIQENKIPFEIPQNWEWKSLGEIASVIQSGFAINKSNEMPNGYIHLRTHNIATDGSLNFDTLVKVKKELIKEQQSFIEEGDILFNNTNSTELVGKTALVTQNYNYAFSNHITKIKLFNQYNSKLVVFYFVLLLKNKYFERICHKWIGQSGINTDKLKQIQIPLPKDIKEQEQIANYLDSIFAKIKKLKELYSTQLKDYEELKKSLLEEAFSGKL